MSGNKPVKWKVGKADEVWKLMICARDAENAKELITHLAYILDNPGGGATLEDCADVIRRFSGEQIAESLLDYRNSAMLSVLAASVKDEDDER
jgi:hypothetical protein